MQPTVLDRLETPPEPLSVVGCHEDAQVIADHFATTSSGEEGCDCGCNDYGDPFEGMPPGWEKCNRASFRSVFRKGDVVYKLVRRYNDHMNRYEVARIHRALRIPQLAPFCPDATLYEVPFVNGASAGITPVVAMPFYWRKEPATLNLNERDEAVEAMLEHSRWMGVNDVHTKPNRRWRGDQPIVIDWGNGCCSNGKVCDHGRAGVFPPDWS